MGSLRHLRKRNTIVKCRLGILQIGDDGWILNEEDYDREALLAIPHVVDGSIYEPRSGVSSAADTATFDDKYLTVIKDVYAQKDAYSEKSGHVLLGTLNAEFGKHGLSHIGSQKRKELESHIEDELKEITAMVFAAGEPEVDDSEADESETDDGIEGQIPTVEAADTEMAAREFYTGSVEAGEPVSENASLPSDE